MSEDLTNIININFERIEIQKNEISSTVESITKDILNVRTYIMQLSWRGKKYNEFIKLYNEEICNLIGVINYLKKLPNVLDIIEKIYRKADEEMKRYLINNLEFESTKIDTIEQNKGQDEINMDKANIENVKDELTKIKKDLELLLNECEKTINVVSIVDEEIKEKLSKDFNEIKDYLTNFMIKLIELLDDALVSYQNAENKNKG